MAPGHLLDHARSQIYAHPAYSTSFSSASNVDWEESSAATGTDITGVDMAGTATSATGDIAATTTTTAGTATGRPLTAGVYVPTHAFFDLDSEDLDLDTTRRHAVRLARAGVAGITTHGSNGEAAHLTPDERHAVTRATRDALDEAGLGSLPIIAGCGAQSTRETVALCRDAARAGADYALVLPPSYYKTLMTRDSLLDFFRDVATASPVPLVIYNFPGAAGGLDLDSDALVELAAHPHIAGVKLTCGNTGKLARVAAATNAVTPASPGSGFVVLGGSADFALQTLVVGGSGILAGLGNIAPRACVRLVQLYAAGNLAKAQKLQVPVAQADWVAIKGGVVGGKCGLVSHFGYGGYGRRPLPRPTPAEKSAFRSGFAELVAIENGLANESDS